MQATTDSMVAARSGAVLGAHTILKVLLLDPETRFAFVVMEGHVT